MSSINSSQPPLHESIREIEKSTWLISNTLPLTHSPSPPPVNASTDQAYAYWSDSNEGHFLLFPAPKPLPNSKVPPEDLPPEAYSSPISIVHAVNNQAAIWRAGEAFIKAHHLDCPDVTREHVTLQFLQDQNAQSDLGFQFPRVLYHCEVGSIYFLVISRVPGQLLDEAWPSMDETLRDYYIGKVADICDALATWKSDSIAGVDGNQLLERYLIKPSSSSSNSYNGKRVGEVLSPKQLLKNCTEMSMDVSKFVFYHCDLGPTNILVDVGTGSLSIIDWEVAGYVPVEWVRTKFRLSAGIDLEVGDEISKRDWRRRVAGRLGEMGYGDVVDAWWKFQYS